MYSAIDLSKYIVSKCIDDDYPITNLQLQKFLYYIQKAFLNRGSQAFSDDIEAWQFGPVVPEVYYRYCGFGAMPISFANDTEIKLCDIDKEEIDGIVEAKRELFPWDLVEETHKEGGAWDLIYNNGEGNHTVIPIDLIKEVG